jgi:hypothetical protein
VEKANWTLFGNRPKNPAPSWVAVVLAFFLASQTFIQVGESYPLYMTLFALGGSAWMVFLAIQARAWFGFFFIPAALLWLNPLLGGDPFTSFTVLMFMAHAALAILFGVAAYTFAARERTKK